LGKSLTLHFKLLASVCALSLIMGNSYAQENNDIAKYIEVKEGGKTLYLVQYFTQYSPDNASEMVSRIPGFNVQSGDDLRGIAGTEGNVLIDGARISTKGQSISQYLSTISAKSIERIEIWQGQALGTMGGKYTMLTNIVRKNDEKTSLSLEAQYRSWGENSAPNYELKYSAKKSGINLSATIYDFTGQKEQRTGYEALFDNNQNIIEKGKNWEIQTYKETGINLSGDTDFRNHKINVNLGLGTGNYSHPWNYIATNGQTPAPIRTDLGYDSEKSKNLNFGIGIAHKFGKYDTKLDYSFKSNESDGAYDAGSFTPNNQPVFYKFAPFAKLQENVAQISFARKMKKHSTSFGGEIGRTTLENSSELFVGDGNIYELVPDSFSQTNVSETRGEIFVADTYSINPKLSLEGKIRIEKSHIAQAGDNEKQRDFIYTKPRLALSYRPRERESLILSYERELGQLDFDDFAFQAELREGNNTQGNANLRPDKTNSLKFEFEKSWGKNGNISFYLVNREINDAVALIPIEENGEIIGETIGNIPNAHRYGGGLSGKIPFDNISKGLSLDGSWTIRKSSVIDPFTKKIREYFFQGDNSYNLSLTQNFEAKKLELNIFYFHGERNVQFRSDSQYLWPNIDYWGLGGEYKGIEKFTISSQLEVPNGIKVKRHRIIYDGQRADNIIKTTHYRERQIEPRFTFTIRRNI
jgi:Outer membrane protein beta-barrel family/TonB-dependent Receptor Plug Domain